jgi:hypothetical protein
MPIKYLITFFLIFIYTITFWMIIAGPRKIVAVKTPPCSEVYGRLCGHGGERRTQKLANGMHRTTVQKGDMSVFGNWRGISLLQLYECQAGFCKAHTELRNRKKAQSSSKSPVFRPRPIKKKNSVLRRDRRAFKVGPNFFFLVFSIDKHFFKLSVKTFSLTFIYYKSMLAL